MAHPQLCAPNSLLKRKRESWGVTNLFINKELDVQKAPDRTSHASTKHLKLTHTHRDSALTLVGFLACRCQRRQGVRRRCDSASEGGAAGLASPVETHSNLRMESPGHRDEQGVERGQVGGGGGGERGRETYLQPLQQDRSHEDHYAEPDSHVPHAELGQSTHHLALPLCNRHF